MYLLLLITHSAYFLSGCGGGFRGCKEGEQPPHIIAGNMLYYSARQILNSFFFFQFAWSTAKIVLVFFKLC